MNTTEFLTIASAIVPEREAVVFEDKRPTFQHLQERVYKLANALSGLGVKAGDRIAMLQVNTNACIEAYFATASLNCVYVPLNFRAKAQELQFMLQDSQSSVLLVGQRYTDLVAGIKDKLPDLKHIIGLEGNIDPLPNYESLIANGADDPLFPEVDESDTTILMFTAGTTGQPKGVMLSHNSFSSYVVNNVSPADPESHAEKNILTVPLYHIAGIQAMMSAVYGGRCVVIERQFEPVEWMELVQREKVNRAMLVPTMLKQLMDHPDFKKNDLSSLKVITYGAAPMPLEVIKRALEEFPGVSFINAFGQTESAATITMLAPEDHVIAAKTPEEREKKLKRLASIGKPLPDVDVRIVDESGTEASVGQVGEIVARGPRLMKGYWKQEEATKRTIRGGWLYTGDLGFRDEEGYIFLAGRAKDIIKRGGEMISPEEVENCILSHPKVEDVAIIGVPDVHWGERVRAVVVLKNSQKASEQEIVEWCRSRLSSYKKPESVVFVDELPRNPMGKILKRVLREQFNQPVVG
ncbi:MAG: long-chain-fatty-acid--CoA ligase [Chloroflexi bacterium]|nr:long-chain-fatty-acid--CoA ligase [Chloroflexota bacterium]